MDWKKIKILIISCFTAHNEMHTSTVAAGNLKPLGPLCVYGALGKSPTFLVLKPAHNPWETSHYFTRNWSLSKENWVLQQLRFVSVCFSTHFYRWVAQHSFKIQLEAYKATDGENTAEKKEANCKGKHIYHHTSVLGLPKETSRWVFEEKKKKRLHI